MKSQRFLGLFFVGLFLVACWFSFVLGSNEDPWDENKLMTGDTTTTLGKNGGSNNNFVGRISIVVPSGVGFAKYFGTRIILSPRVGSCSLGKSEARRTSHYGPNVQKIALPSGGQSKTKK